MNGARLFLAGTALAALAAAAGAQQPPPNEWLLVHEEAVQPSKSAQYEAALKDFVGLLSEKKVHLPQVRFATIMTMDMRYFFVTPIGSLAGLQANLEEWDRLGEVLGPARWQAVQDRAASAMLFSNNGVVLRRNDLAYFPKAPRMRPEEHRFIRYNVYYILPGKRAEAEQLAKDYRALFRRKEIATGYTVFEGVVGSELPYQIVGFGARSAADLAADQETIRQALGEEVRALDRRALSLVRRLETFDAIPRPDLSYLPAPAAAAAR